MRVLKQTLLKALIFNTLLAVSAVVTAEESKKEPATNEITPEQMTALKKEEDANTKYLLANVLAKAKVLQEKYGDFAPFAAGLFKSGKVNYVWLAKPGETIAEPAKALPILRETLNAQAVKGLVLGAAVVYKYGPPENPQINVELEYVTGYAKLFGAQYSQMGDVVTFGQSASKDFDRHVFVPREETN